MVCCQEAQLQLASQLSALHDRQLYEALIQMGRSFPMLSKEGCLESDRVPGCQSLLYLTVQEESGLLFFKIYSDALISRGLAALLVEVYQGTPPTCLLTHRLTLFKDLALDKLISPIRTNGISSLHLRMQQEALALASCSQRATPSLSSSHSTQQGKSG